MAGLFIWLWVLGGFPAAVLGEVVRADSPRVARAGRIGFALLLGVDLLLAALILAVGADAPSSHMTTGLWWFTIAVAGVPLALVSGLAVRRGYAGHRSVLAVATLTTAALYVVFPLAFVPLTAPKLTGLGLFAHDHHLLGVALLLIPTLILLVDELRWEGGPEPEPDEGGLSLGFGSGRHRWRNIGGGVASVAVLVWMAGTNAAGLLLGLGLVFTFFAVVLWRKHRLAMRAALRDLGPLQKP
jgi:hypothetical protein